MDEVVKTILKDREWSLIVFPRIMFVICFKTPLNEEEAALLTDEDFHWIFESMWTGNTRWHEWIMENLQLEPSNMGLRHYV